MSHKKRKDKRNFESWFDRIDFGKYTTLFITSMFGQLFYFVCGITIWFKETSTLKTFIVSSMVMFTTALTAIIWKEKSVYLRKLAQKFKLEVKSLKDLEILAPKEQTAIQSNDFDIGTNFSEDVPYSDIEGEV